MKIVWTFILSCASLLFYAQESEKSERQLSREAREEVRKGNEIYYQLDFKEAEKIYQKALEKDPKNAKAAYNLANTLYQQNKFKESSKLFKSVENKFTDKYHKASVYHNVGNSFLKEKKYSEAVESYKKSLRNNSKDDETRYNLALAMKLLKEEQKKNKDKDKDKNKDKKDKKDNKDKKGDKGKDEDKEKENKKDKGDDQKKDDPSKKDKGNKKEKPQQRPSKLTPQQMKQLLEAMNNEELKTQKKLNANKATVKKLKREKDW